MLPTICPPGMPLTTLSSSPRRFADASQSWALVSLLSPRLWRESGVAPQTVRARRRRYRSFFSHDTATQPWSRWRSSIVWWRWWTACSSKVLRVNASCESANRSRRSVDLAVDRMRGVTAAQSLFPLQISKQVLASGGTVIKAANILRPQLKVGLASAFSLILKSRSSSLLLSRTVHCLNLFPIWPASQMPSNLLMRCSGVLFFLRSSSLVSDSSRSSGPRGRLEKALPHPYEYELQHLVFPQALLEPAKERIFGGTLLLVMSFGFSLNSSCRAREHSHHMDRLGGGARDSGRQAVVRD